jgi:tRNA (cytidine/uridine-2'-O-)-methyltransferase
MHIALYEPEIPGNTGSIGRVCVGTATPLHLIGRLGFSIDEAAVRRAGLDYWHKVQLHRHDDLDGLRRATNGQRIWAFSAHGLRRYDEVQFGADDVLLFGAESRGLPLAVRDSLADSLLYVPTNGDIRSLNLANCVSLVLYEALRQRGFAGIDSRKLS